MKLETLGLWGSKGTIRRLLMLAALSLADIGAAANAQNALLDQPPPTLNGPVRAVKVIGFKSSDTAHKWQREELSEITEYDEKGRVRSTKYVDLHSSVSGSNYFKYDHRDLLIVVDSLDSNKVPVSKVEFRRQPGSKYPSEIRHYHSDSLVFSDIYDWKSNHRIAKVKRLYPADLSITTIASFSYDRAGKIIKTKYSKPDGEFISAEFYSYDKSGYPVRFRLISKESGVLQGRFIYSFDGHGNWTRRIKRINRHKTNNSYPPDELLVRTIEYR
jgi:hypothetical protein